MPLRLAILATLGLVVLPPAFLLSRASQSPAPPRGHLLVIVVVDQMRFDYFQRMESAWTRGFARLGREGAVFERAAYPYLNTVTCAGHATIATGSFPATHGVIMNEWWQRAAGRRMTCTEEPGILAVPYRGKPESIGHSAHRLRMPTLGDRLRARSSESRVVTVALKPRSTVMLAGHGGTAVTWYSEANSWATSTAFAGEPVAEVDAFVAANPIARYRGEVWDRLRETSAYTGRDNGVGERPPRGWSPIFPHPLAGDPGTAPERFPDLWERSPFSDVVLGEMAAHLVRTLRLGRRGMVDYLGVSFSALDYVGHDFGPNSHEVQDTLLRLDQTLGTLLARLDDTVGPENYTLALSADHGVSRIPEELSANGQQAGRVLNADVQKVAEAAMTAAHGPGPHVAHVEYSELYLTDRGRALAGTDATALQPLIDALARMPGVLRVIPAAELETKPTGADPVARAAALSHYPGESGDVKIVLQPNWVGTNTSAATHGTLHPYDQHVPVIFFGKRIRAGRYVEAATPADIAPTLAFLAGLDFPRTDGRVLTPALR